VVNPSIRDYVNRYRWYPEGAAFKVASIHAQDPQFDQFVLEYFLRYRTDLFVLGAIPTMSYGFRFAQGADFTQHMGTKQDIVPLKPCIITDAANSFYLYLDGSHDFIWIAGTVEAWYRRCQTHLYTELGASSDLFSQEVRGIVILPDDTFVINRFTFQENGATFIVEGVSSCHQPQTHFRWLFQKCQKIQILPHSDLPVSQPNELFQAWLLNDEYTHSPAYPGHLITKLHCKNYKLLIEYETRQIEWLE
jgi:hypothetical protein